MHAMIRTTLFLIVGLSLVAGCSPKVTPSSDATRAKDKKMPALRYTTDIAPLLVRSCSPCHYPAQGGRKEALDSYATVSAHAREILTRVTRPQTDVEFMPYKLKKPALTPEEVATLRAWIDGGRKE